MIRLKRLNGKDFVLNCELIKTVEETPDTLITLVNGEKLLVLEPVDVVLSQVADWQRRAAR